MADSASGLLCCYILAISGITGFYFFNFPNQMGTDFTNVNVRLSPPSLRPSVTRRSSGYVPSAVLNVLHTQPHLLEERAMNASKTGDGGEVRRALSAVETNKAGGGWRMRRLLLRSTWTAPPWSALNKSVTEDAQSPAGVPARVGQGKARQMHAQGRAGGPAP